MGKFDKKDKGSIKEGDLVRLNWQDTRDLKVHNFLESCVDFNEFKVEEISGGMAKLEGVPFSVKLLDLLPERKNKLKVK